MLLLIIKFFLILKIEGIKKNMLNFLDRCGTVVAGCWLVRRHIPRETPHHHVTSKHFLSPPVPDREYQADREPS